MVTVRNRGTLPHWESPLGIYFVTFRLADSLPRSVAAAIEFERRNIVGTAKAVLRPLSAVERKRLVKLFSEKYDSYLDGGAGSCVLARPAIAKIVADALSHFQRIRYRVFAWCVMPNHVHIVFQPTGNWTLAQILHSWKSYSAHKVAKVLESSEKLWERKYYDHLIRSDADLYRCVRYVLDNPAKAGLRGWPWFGEAFSR